MEGIISKMNQDVYTLTIKADPLLLTNAAILMERDGLRRKGESSYKLKSLAKLLEKGQELSNNANLAVKDLIDAKKWDLTVQSVKALTGYDEAEIEVPSLFVKLGYALQHLARVAQSMGLRTEDDSLIKKCNNFLELYESEWNVYTTHVRIQFDNNRNKAPQNLPLAKDIKLLREYCKGEINRLFKVEEFGKTEWRELAEATLCRIITVNTRRGGEPPPLTVEEWEDAINDKWKRNEAISFLTEAERHLADRLKVVYITGKRR